MGNQDITGRIVFSGAFLLGGKTRNVHMITIMSERQSLKGKYRKMLEELRIKSK